MLASNKAMWMLLLAAGMVSSETDAPHPKRDYLTVEEKADGYQLGPDKWARPPESGWSAANERLSDKRSLHCPVCISLAVRLYNTVSKIADSTGGAKIATSWRMKNSQREFKMTDAMKSDTVIGEAMEDLCDSREVPSQIPGVENTKESLKENSSVMGVKLSTSKDAFSWREGGKEGVRFTKNDYVDICEDLVQEDEARLVDAVSSIIGVK
jgi:hypothetical protein